MIPQITIEADKALARFSPAGIPNAVRRNLRRVLPDLTKMVGNLVNSKLDAGLQSRRRVKITQEMVENPKEIYGEVKAVWTGDASKAFVPTILESGAVAHAIVAVNAKALYFFWPKLNQFVSFKSVWHPGFAGIHYMRDAFAERRDTIRVRLEDAVKRGLVEGGVK